MLICIRRLFIPLVLMVPLAACGPTNAGPRASPAPASRVTTRVAIPPEVVDGIPLRRIADGARSMAAMWSEPHPWKIRTAIGSALQANSLGDIGTATYHFGDIAPQYVVALDGRFMCLPPACAEPSPPESAGVKQRPIPSPVPVSTMVFTIQITPGRGGGVLSVWNHEVDMSRLGKVYSLDEYP
jgi:hypothetical protein